MAGYHVYTLNVLNEDGTRVTLIARFTTRELTQQVKETWYNDPWHEVTESFYEPPVVFNTLEEYQTHAEQERFNSIKRKLTKDDLEYLRNVLEKK